MSPILIKIFATALAFSQVTTRPDAVKTHFDPVADRSGFVDVKQRIEAVKFGINYRFGWGKTPPPAVAKY